eukprot:scaffold45678_cov199-Amphora_coffeaeformis.AAC.3
MAGSFSAVVTICLWARNVRTNTSTNTMSYTTMVTSCTIVEWCRRDRELKMGHRAGWIVIASLAPQIPGK